MSSSFPSILLATALAAAPLLAKRPAPKPVQPVLRNGVIYSVPHELMMGVVAATDLKTGTVLWRRQVYTVRIDPDLEADVQDCYITDLQVDDDRIRVQNERGGLYTLDLKSLQVQAVRGPLVVQHPAS